MDNKTNFFGDVTVIIPTLNEADSIGKLTTALLEMYPGIRVLVVDDESHDGTGQIAKNFGAAVLLRGHLRMKNGMNVHKKGLTGSVIDGIKICETQYFIVMDGDGQHPVETIGEMITSLRGGYIMAIGIRRHIQEGWSLYRRITSLSAQALANIRLFISGAPRCSDPTSGLFGMPMYIANIYLNKNFIFEGYKVMFGFLKHFPRGVLIKEIEYDFNIREHGKSKMGLKQIIALLKSVIR